MAKSLYTKITVTKYLRFSQRHFKKTQNQSSSTNGKKIIKISRLIKKTMSLLSTSIFIDRNLVD